MKYFYDPGWTFWRKRTLLQFKKKGKGKIPIANGLAADVLTIYFSSALAALYLQYISNWLNDWFTHDSSFRGIDIAVCAHWSDNLQLPCEQPTTSLQIRPLRLFMQVIWGDILNSGEKYQGQVRQDREGLSIDRTDRTIPTFVTEWFMTGETKLTFN